MTAPCFHTNQQITAARIGKNAEAARNIAPAGQPQLELQPFILRL